MERVHEASYMTPSGYQPNSCGYCLSKPLQTSRSYYAWSGVHAVHPKHYQRLVDRGWRRSGTTWYKPDVRNSCCPHYTIRLPAHDFQSKKDQRRAVNQFTDYIFGLEYKHKAARLCPKSPEEKKLRRNHFDLCRAIHEPEYNSIKRPIDPAENVCIEPAHKLQVTLEPDNYSAEKYALFENYQRIVHKEPRNRISPGGFKSFLCSGMQQGVYNAEGVSRQIGSFHQCYRLDGRLVAVGVLDLLPHGVSSVYLIYHDDVSQWELGKISALREIALAIEKGYDYYYMGYYIHDCVKMKYKRNFSPTFVLDPETYNWNLLGNDMLARMSVRKYVSLSRELRMGLEAPTADALATLSDSPCNEKLAPMEFDGDVGDLFDTDMPGVMTKEEVQRQVSLSDIKLKRDDNVFNLNHAGEWNLNERADDSPFVYIAEFVACIGPDLAKQIVINLG